MDQSTQNLFDLQIDQNSNSYLSEAAKWGKFLAIMGFIFCGLLVIIALFAGTMMASMMSGFGGSDAAAGAAGVSGMALTFVYIVFALIYFFPCLYLFNFSSKMQAALRSNQQDSLNTAFRNLKSCFKFMGILMIVILAFWVLAIVIGIGAAVTAGV
jgi:uncharacterized membrane protein YesL